MDSNDSITQYYWYNGLKVPLNISQTREAVQIHDKNRVSFREFLGNAPELLIEDDVIDLGNEVFIINKKVNNSLESANKGKFEESNKSINIYENDTTQSIILNDFIVRFKDETSSEDIEILNRKYNASIISTYEWDEKCFLLFIPDTSEDEIIQISNKYYENQFVEYAHPNFIELITAPAAPNDALFERQWALSNKGQTGGIAGNDINIIDAWAITPGNPSITIAIIDDGVDYNHEDLNIGNKLVTPYNALTKSSNNNLGVLDSHGTCCAGVASATGNNDMGIIGVAPECRLMGVKVMTKISSTSWRIDVTKIADGINVAVQRGADVLSNSWFCRPNDHVRRAILNAKNNGRGGKGCVICCAAGNNGGAVVFPAALPDVLTVSACNEFGEFKTRTSRDNEPFWASSFGRGVDICAPGVHIATTTKMFDNPNPPLRNYILDFRGTSASTPFVAGVAALILSSSPSLSANQVENIIKASADALGEHIPSDRVGFGRVNAFKALLQIQTINI